jgi:hypothetical protein
MYQEMPNSEIDDVNSKIADGLYSDGWSQNEIDEYVADLSDKYDQTLDPIDPEVRKYYLELLPRLSNTVNRNTFLIKLLLTSYTMKN